MPVLLNPRRSATPQIIWEYIPCPLCGADDEETVLETKPADSPRSCRLVCCRACGMGYMNPRPDEASIGYFYPEEYEEYEPRISVTGGMWGSLERYLERLVMAYYFRDPPPLRRCYEKALAIAAGTWLCPSRDSLTALPFHGEGKLLDFGCGSGWYAHRMHQRGWTVTGLDFSAFAARRVGEHFGIPVLVGTLPHPQIEPSTFDVITMGCVLEHVHHPRQVVAAAAQALRPGGLLVISVPNLDSWGFRYFGTDWWPLELPRHLLHFTQHTLRRLALAEGLEIYSQRMLGRTSWMRRSLNFAHRSQRGSAMRRLLARLRGIRAVPSLLTRWTMRNKEADCIMLVARRRVEG